MLLTQIMHNYLTWPLCSPRHCMYVILFDLKPLIENGNLQVYMYHVHARKGASGAPRTHLRACKISKFRGACPQTPLTQSICGAPLFVFALGPPNALGGPAYIQWHSYSLGCNFWVGTRNNVGEASCEVLRMNVRAGGDGFAWTLTLTIKQGQNYKPFSRGSHVLLF